LPVINGVVFSNEVLAPEHYFMNISAPEIARLAEPGQFVHVRCSSGLDPFLRRPFSVHDLDPERGTISLLYLVKGRGTKWLVSQLPGNSLEIMGPLGRGFMSPGEGIDREVVIVGGGVGVAPLLPLVRLLAKKGFRIRVLIGAPTAALLLRAGAFQKEGAEVILTTEDGSSGSQGTVATVLPSLLATAKTSYMYACGPRGMLKAVAAVANQYHLPLQISLDTYFACGVGACQGCVCRVNSSLPGEQAYLRVCRDGPVFLAEEVILDD
jgi:dihydroorotate dehydrogenase electron transfer subunit